MALFTGNVTESLIKKGKRFIKFIGMGRDDVKQHRVIAPWGDESAPIEGAVAIYGNTSVNGEAVVIGYINTVALGTMSPGEKRVFSTDANGNLSYFLHFKKDGTAEFGGVGDFLVKFNALKAGFDAHIAEYNAHFHTGNIGAPTTPPTIPATASIDAAKHNKIKTE